MIRPFEPRHYERIVAIGARLDPALWPSREAMRYRDRTWSPEHRKARLVVMRADEVVGWGQVAHMWWAYHPRRFAMRLEVDPAAQRGGLGSLLYAQLMAQLREWDAELVRTDARESCPQAVAWLTRRGYSEIQRRRELRLRLDHFDPLAFPDPDQLLARHGLQVATYGALRAKGGERLVRELYELEIMGGEDEPRPEQDIAMSFDRFVTQELEQRQALPDANFLAFYGERLVGVSRLERHLAHPGVLLQGFTTVHPDHRGRRTALALKLHTIRYAQAHGYREILTTNDSTNAPMLHINQALGFRQFGQRLVFERRFDQ
jgi:GNAT superfamily N-acetyltransferase